MKKVILENVDAIMVEKLINFENYKIKLFQTLEDFFNRDSSISNKEKEELLEKFKQHLQEEEEPNQFVLGGKFNQYVLEYDKSTNNIIFKDETDDSFGFGVEIKDIDLDDETLDDIACSLNEQIEEYFGDKIIEDCGVYWEIKE